MRVRKGLGEGGRRRPVCVTTREKTMGNVRFIIMIRKPHRSDAQLDNMFQGEIGGVGAGACGTDQNKRLDKRQQMRAKTPCTRRESTRYKEDRNKG